MNKCRNCGKEFEGKFCPDCGEKAVQPLFEEFVTNPEAEVTTENQQFDLKSLDKKKLFEFNYISRITSRFLSFLLGALVLFFIIIIILLTITSRNIFVTINDIEDVLTPKPL